MKRGLISILASFCVLTSVATTPAKTSLTQAQRSELSLGKLKARRVMIVDGEKVKAERFRQELSIVPQAEQLFVNGRTLRTLGTVVQITGIAMMIYPIGKDVYKAIKNDKPKNPYHNNDKESGFYESGLFYGGIGMLGIGIALWCAGNSSVKKSVTKYNSAGDPTIAAFTLTPSQKGLGICLNF